MPVHLVIIKLMEGEKSDDKSVKQDKYILENW